jgi:3-hydroxyisobutyrate dehydrogenase-like beta-hydroxyacid dehydrogenase
MATRVGIIGIGLLGSALAERLLRAGFQVVGFDIDQQRRAEFASDGGEAAESGLEVAAASDRLLLSLPDSQVVEAVVAEIEPAVREQAVIIDTTTGAPSRVVKVGEHLAARQVSYLDATVAGSSQQARDGKIVIMAGGDQPSFDACNDIFAALAERVYYVGPSGSGARMKLIVNLVLGLNRAVLAEGLSLAKACGMDLNTSLEVLRSGAAYSAAMDSKGDKMITEDFSPQARLAQHLKDVGLILDLSHEAGTELPLTLVHQELLRKACELGYAAADNSAVIKAFD